MLYIGIAVCVIVIIAAVIITNKRNNEIRTAGIEADAVVSRIKEDTSTDADGSISGTTYTYYVRYTMQNGEEVEAKLGSGKGIDNQIGGVRWAKDLQEGSPVRIKYLPEKPKYVIRA